MELKQRVRKLFVEMEEENAKHDIPMCANCVSYSSGCCIHGNILSYVKTKTPEPLVSTMKSFQPDKEFCCFYFRNKYEEGR